MAFVNNFIYESPEKRRITGRSIEASMRKTSSINARRRPVNTDFRA
jgi:hypothetical protein